MNNFDLVIVGAGPGGIALAAEAHACALDSARAIILEKGASHNWAIRQFYPEQKLTTANYKGFQARCEGLLCIHDMSKVETLDYFDRIIRDYNLQIQYETAVSSARPAEAESGSRFIVETSRGAYRTRVLAVAIGILGRPNKPKDYALPGSLKDRLLFDITSRRIEDENVLVVGGGDSASEYSEYLGAQRNRVTLSYRGTEFVRLNDRNRETLASLEKTGAVKILRGSNIARVEDDGGRPRVYFREDPYPAQTFDRVVYALGGSTPTNFLKTLGVTFENDRPVFDETGETAVPGLFILGDLVVGRTGGSIITAFNSAVRAMRRICEGYVECGPCAPKG